MKSMHNKAVLLLEDDIELGETIQELLEGEGYSVTLVRDGNNALDRSYDTKFDLYIFDINVPEISGLDLLKSLRDADDTTPAIFISALVDLNSISQAFRVGANDYIKKPFFPEELLIRVNAKFMLSEKTVLYKHLEYNFSTRVLKQNGQIVSLGGVLICLLESLLKNRGDILDKEILLECLENPSSTALRVAINKLKTKLSLDIKNIRGVGYVIE